MRFFFQLWRTTPQIVALFLFSANGMIQAAIAPHEFQYKATEVLDLVIDSVQEAEGRVTIDARILRIHESESGLEVGATLTIHYREKDLERRHSFWDRMFPKPGRQELFPPDLPAEGDRIQAYLKPNRDEEAPTWMPAAHQYSFRPVGADPVIRDERG